MIFSHNPKKKLFSNKLNISRLKQAGLKIPTLNEDFKNGTFQSKIYMKKYLKKNEKKNILEIGCSFGYFSKFTQKKQFQKYYSVEINQTCKNFINKKLKIPCYSTIEDIEKKFYLIKYFYFIVLNTFSNRKNI